MWEPRSHLTPTQTDAFHLKPLYKSCFFLAAPEQWHLAIARDVFPSCTDIFFLSTETKIKRLDPDCMDKLERSWKTEQKTWLSFKELMFWFKMYGKSRRKSPNFLSSWRYLVLLWHFRRRVGEKPSA